MNLLRVIMPASLATLDTLSRVSVETLYLCASWRTAVVAVGEDTWLERDA